MRRRAAPIWDEDPELKAEARRPNGHDAKRRIELVPFNDMQPNLTEADLVAGLLGTAQMSAIYGPPGCGKTFLALDIGLRVATGRKCLRRRVKQGVCVYIAAEAGRRIFNRVAAWRSRRMRDDDGEAVPFLVVPQQLDLCNTDEDLDELVAAIREACDAAPLLIIVDTVSRVMAGGNENSPEDMGALIAAADRLRDEFGAHVCLIHHVGKDAGRGARGHSSLFAAIDTAIEVTRNEETGLSTARVAKQRDGETGEKIHFALDVVEIGENAETGEAVTSCVVVPPDATQVAEEERSRAGEGLSKAEKIALNALRCVLEAEGATPPAAAKCPSDRWVRDDVWRARCYRDGISSGKPRAQQMAFQSAAIGLVREKLVGMQDGFAWLL